MLMIFYDRLEMESVSLRWYKCQWKVIKLMSVSMECGYLIQSKSYLSFRRKETKDQIKRPNFPSCSPRLTKGFTVKEVNLNNAEKCSHWHCPWLPWALLNLLGDDQRQRCHAKGLWCRSGWRRGQFCQTKGEKNISTSQEKESPLSYRIRMSGPGEVRESQN